MKLRTIDVPVPAALIEIPFWVTLAVCVNMAKLYCWFTHHGRR